MIPTMMPSMKRAAKRTPNPPGFELPPGGG